MSVWRELSGYGIKYSDVRLLGRECSVGECTGKREWCEGV